MIILATENKAKLLLGFATTTQSPGDCTHEATNDLGWPSGWTRKAGGMKNKTTLWKNSVKSRCWKLSPRPKERSSHTLTTFLPMFMIPSHLTCKSKEHISMNTSKSMETNIPSSNIVTNFNKVSLRYMGTWWLASAIFLTHWKDACCSLSVCPFFWFITCVHDDERMEPSSSWACKTSKASIQKRDLVRQNYTLGIPHCTLVSRWRIHTPNLVRDPTTWCTNFEAEIHLSQVKARCQHELTSSAYMT